MFNEFSSKRPPAPENAGGISTPIHPTLSPDVSPRDFSIGLLRAVINDPKFWQEARVLLKPEDFDLSPCAIIYETALGHYERTGTMLTGEALAIAVRQAIHNGQACIAESEHEPLAEVLERVNQGAVDVDFYRSELRRYIFLMRLMGLRLQHGIDTFASCANSEAFLDDAQKIRLEILHGGDSTFPRLTLADLAAFIPDPADNLAGICYLRRGGGTLLTGGTGLGKSVLAMQIAVSCAAGIDILGRIHVHRPMRVLLIEAENAVEVLKRDVLSIVGRLNADRELVQKNLVVRHVYGLSGKAFTAALPGWIAQEKPDLLVIDPYQSYCGGIDMNSTQSFLQWIEPVDRAIKQNQCGLLLVAHTGKPKGAGFDWNARQMVYLASGTSALANWCRSSMELLPAGQEEDRFRLTIGKGAEAAAISAPHGLMGASRIVRELYVEHSGNSMMPYWKVADDQTAPGDGQFEDAVREYLAENPEESTREIATATGCSQSTAARLIRKIRHEK